VRSADPPARQAALEARRAELRARLVAAGGGAAAGRSRWARTFLTTCAVLLAVAGSAAVVGGVLVHRYTETVREEPLLGAAAATAPASTDSPVVTPNASGSTRSRAPGRAGGGLNILLVGIDERAGSPGAGVRSDTIMIAHIPAARDRVYLISIPRDSRVEIPAYRRTGYAGGIDKVNAAYEHGARGPGGRAGGFELLALTLRSLTGVAFNAGAILNFDGLRSVVDAVGGVDMCVDEETTSIHIGWDTATGKQGAPYTLSPPHHDKPRPVPGMRAQVYHVGCRHFVGWEALDYVRQRELIPDGDYGRQRHQQQLVKALTERLTRAGLLTDPFALDRTLRALGGSVTFDGNGRSLTDWILTMRGLDPDSITMIRTNGGRFATRTVDGRAFEVLGQTSLALFAALRNGTVGDFTAAHPDWVIQR
jgi:LCP family protein required for cell wall assembly